MRFSINWQSYAIYVEEVTQNIFQNTSIVLLQFAHTRCDSFLFCFGCFCAVEMILDEAIRNTYFFSGCFSMTSLSVEYNFPTKTWNVTKRIRIQIDVNQNSVQRYFTCRLITSKFSLAKLYCFCTSSDLLSVLFSLNASLIRLNA